MESLPDRSDGSVLGRSDAPGISGVKREIGKKGKERRRNEKNI
jgi:hypothetical protein